MYQKKYEELKFTDDFMFCKILMGNKDICKEIIELLLGVKVKNIVYLEEQKPIEITSDGKGIRLDVYLEDGNTVYDLEMQTTISKDIAKRSRYYQGMIDLNLISRGAAYSELKESYIVFICLEDLFKKNRSLYTFSNICLEDNELILEDGTTRVFVNASGSRDGLTSAQIAFLDYVSGKEPTDELTTKLSMEVKRARDKEEWRNEYMTLLQRDREKYEEGKVEGRAEGKAEGKAEALIALVTDGLLDIDIAAKRLNKSPEELLEIINNNRK
ncbi:Rpn family recombination-promoting nuclease/putative transposase [Pseudobutyrivibrio sp.]|uniref:Rpn family recombination-promoting nuclease/putative transposase n=1 Tax=Pseudobutyrivibrio sp. TaxID=2014367 RepID=UPI003870DCC7